MRLRKKIKRTAAAALALGVAVSSAAPAALGTYYCDVSKGNITVVKDENGTTVSVTDNSGNTLNEGVESVDDEKDDVIFYDSNNHDRYKEDTGNTSGGVNDWGGSEDVDVPVGQTTEDVSAEEDVDAGFATMDLTPEDYGETETADAETAGDESAAEDDTAQKTEEPERTVTETELGTVI